MDVVTLDLACPKCFKITKHQYLQKELNDCLDFFHTVARHACACPKILTRGAGQAGSRGGCLKRGGGGAGTLLQTMVEIINWLCNFNWVLLGIQGLLQIANCQYFQKDTSLTWEGFLHVLRHVNSFFSDIPQNALVQSKCRIL